MNQTSKLNSSTESNSQVQQKTAVGDNDTKHTWASKHKLSVATGLWHLNIRSWDQRFTHWQYHRALAVPCKLTTLLTCWCASLLQAETLWILFIAWTTRFILVWLSFELTTSCIAWWRGLCLDRWRGCLWSGIAVGKVHCSSAGWCWAFEPWGSRSRGPKTKE